MIKVHSKVSMGKTSPSPDAILHTMIGDEKPVLDRYDFGEKLGEGSFGVVYNVTNRESRERWACKIINKEKAGGSKVKLINREVGILKLVHHDHIIKLREVFETSQKIYLVMELCEGGELSKLVSRRGGSLPEADVRIIMKRLASAISYLHRSGMVHRDLKLENVLLSKNPADGSDKLYIKVTDFGLSVVKNGVKADDMMDEFCGTPLYMAPEIRTNKTYSEKCDVWAMGIIMCILLTGQHPTPPVNDADEADSCNGNNHLMSAKEWIKISNPAKDCISRMLDRDTAYRYTASEILTHHFIENVEPETKMNVLEMMKEFHKDGVDFSDDVVISDVIDPEAAAQNNRSNSAPGSTAPLRRNGKQDHLPPQPCVKTNSLSRTLDSLQSSRVKTKTSTVRPRSSILEETSSDIAFKNTTVKPLSSTRASISAPQGVTLRTTLKSSATGRDKLDDVRPTGDSRNRTKTTSLSLSTGSIADSSKRLSLTRNGTTERNRKFQ